MAALSSGTSLRSGALALAGIALLVVALALGLPRAKQVQAEGPLPRLNLDLRETTVSGISSGAFMATQMGVAHSASIKGVAVTAGGPYFCAGKDSWGGAGLPNILARCMQGDPMFPAKAITPSDQRLMQETTRRWAAEGLIDPLEGLARQKIWIFHGYNDGVAKAPVSDALQTYYRAFVPAHQIFYKRELPAGHAQVSVACAENSVSCNACPVSGGNFINACSDNKTPYDAAGMALQFFYGPMQRTDPLKGKLLSFSQAPYTLKNGKKIKPGTISMADEGYLYVPPSCLEGKACRLHIAFHGCAQNTGRIGMDFVKGAGYNEWAEQNRLVVLFPQATASVALPANPNACWDWWGYNDTGRQVGHYATRNGFQIAAVWRMAQALAHPGGGLENEAKDDSPGGNVTAPVARVLDASSSQVLLIWEAVPDAVAYRVYRVIHEDRLISLPVTPEGFTDTAFVDDGLEEKTRYQYKVTALDATGKETPLHQTISGFSGGLLTVLLTAQTSGSPPACDPYFSMMLGRSVDRNGIPTDSTCP